VDGGRSDWDRLLPADGPPWHHGRGDVVDQVALCPMHERRDDGSGKYSLGKLPARRNGMAIAHPS
jgi:hypothetical protein